MQERQVIYKEVNLKEYKWRGAKVADVSAIVSGEVIFHTKEGEVLAVQKKLPDMPELRAALKSTKYTVSMRLNGGEGNQLKSRSRIFGFRPREALRKKKACTASSLSYEQPDHHGAIVEAGRIISQEYEKYFPEMYKNHLEILKDKVRPEWVMRGTVFTSGISNFNNTLKYHFDSGTFDGILSCMVVYRKNMAGGHLCIPELDLGLSCEDGTLVMFDGKRFLHGVTPMYKTKPDGYRYSAVYYALKAMWKCEAIEDELIRTRQITLDRSRQRDKE